MTRSTTASIGISLLAVLLHGSPVLAEDHPAEANPVSIAPSVVALEEAMIAAAAAVEQSVVTLEIHGNSSSLQGLPQGMERFFPMDGLGSGFFIDERGTILTNHHVIDGAERIDVVFHDGRREAAQVIASDPSSDVGVIRLVQAPKDLVVAPLGDSSGLRVGQFAIAVGAPLGYERSVTVGHVSALHRSAIGQRAPGLVTPGFERLTLQDFIQTDTPINPGNSGGPLVDLRGRVIGVNAAIMAAPGGGLSFSIPINLALDVAEQLEQSGRVSRPWLGVRMSDNNPAQAEAFDLPTSKGAVVVEVFENSPAARAGLAPDDLIVSVAGRVVRSSRDLASAVATADESAPVDVQYFRKVGKKHRRKQLRVQLEPRPEEFERRLVETGSEEEGVEGSGAEDSSVRSRADQDPKRSYLIRALGIELTPAAGTRRAGLRVSAVAQGSFAAAAGLAEGDILIEVGGEPVATIPQLHERLTRAGGPFTSMVVKRGGARRYLSIELPR